MSCRIYQRSNRNESEPCSERSRRRGACTHHRISKCRNASGVREPPAILHVFVSGLPDAAALVVLRPVVIRNVVANTQRDGVVPAEAGGAHAGVGARAGAALEDICTNPNTPPSCQNSGQRSLGQKRAGASSADGKKGLTQKACAKSSSSCLARTVDVDCVVGGGDGVAFGAVLGRARPGLRRRPEHNHFARSRQRHERRRVPLL